MKIEIENLDAVVKMLEGTIDNEKVKESLGRACAVVEASAKTKAPKGTGELRRSITSEVRNINGEPEGVVFTPLEYAPYAEYGTGLFAEEGGRTDVPWSYQDDEGEWHSTSGQHPQPYMRPALNENKKKIAQILKEGLVNG